MAEVYDFTADEARMHTEIVTDLSAERHKRVAPDNDQESNRFRYALDLVSTVNRPFRSIN